ncbi:hypothetical protein [Paraburkholderia xenovorans]
MNQRYVLLVRDPGHPENATLFSDMKEIVPEAKVIEQRGNVYLIECPIFAEVDLFDYFDHEHCTISRERTYQLI